MRILKYNLSAILLIALVSIMWLLPMDVNAEGLPVEMPSVANDEATGKAADVTIVVPGHRLLDEYEAHDKELKLEEYFRGRYGGSEKSGERVRSTDIGVSIQRDRMFLHMDADIDFTPPGFIAQEGEDKYEYLRARALAFLKAEERVFGLDKIQVEFKEIKIGDRWLWNKTEVINVYVMEVEGVPVEDTIFMFYLKDGKPHNVQIKFVAITSEMVSAAKTFRAEGLGAEDIKELVKAMLVKYGRFEHEREEFMLADTKVLLFQEKPYVQWHISYGNTFYEFDAMTGELIADKSMMIDDSEGP